MADPWLNNDGASSALSPPIGSNPAHSTVSADPSPEPGELDEAVRLAIINAPLNHNTTRKVIRMVREAVAKEIEARSKPFIEDWAHSGDMADTIGSDAFGLAAAIARGHRS